MIALPSKKDFENISFTVKVNGTTIPDTYMVISLEVERKIGKVAHAAIELLLDPEEESDEALKPSNAADFVPGNEVEINMGYNGKEDLVFRGIVLRHGIRVQSGQRRVLSVKCQDIAVKMTLGRFSKYYQEMKDSEIISAIASEHGLSAKVEDTTVPHKQIVKYQAGDWDFILGRAEANGLLVYTEDGTLTVEKPLVEGTPKLKLIYGRNVFNFEGEIDARFQWPSVTARSWSPKTQTLLSGKSVEPSVNERGNITGKQLSEVLGISDLELQSTGEILQPELQAWAQGGLLLNRLAAIRGKASIVGNGKTKLNTPIELAGFGDRFNGSVLVSGIRHTVREGEWRTEVTFGLSPDRLSQTRELTPPAAAGLLAAVNGLHNGTVKKIDADPDGEHRILVDVPVITPSGDGIWARMAHPYATQGKGYFWLPEVGDEVVLGFLNDDPRFPVLLGSLYSSKIPPPYTAGEDNAIKAIVTRNDLKIECNDKDKVLTISTPGGNEFILSDKDKTITLNDANGNSVEMASHGIRISSARDFEVTAAGNISLTANAKVDVNADADLNLKGINVNAEGRVGFSGKGGATAELSAGGQTRVKGAMVMIN